METRKDSKKVKEKEQANASELGVVMFLVTLLITYSSRKLIFATVVSIRTGDSMIFIEALSNGDPTIESIIVVGLLNIASGLVGFKLNDKISGETADKDK